MAASQAVTKPLPEEKVELILLVRLMHLRVGIAVDAAETTGVLGANHFSHTRIMVDTYVHLRHWQPGRTVLLTDLDGGV